MKGRRDDYPDCNRPAQDDVADTGATLEFERVPLQDLVLETCRTEAGAADGIRFLVDGAGLDAVTVDGSADHGVSGTGLGLAIARWVAEQHGGTIEVSSNVGGGSRFTLTLPVA